VRAPPPARNHGLRGVANASGYAQPNPRKRKEVLRIVRTRALGDHTFPWCLAPRDMNIDN